ncbi:DUF3108 domain-containing protein [Lutibacter holmesii]|uniref:DUF3108 domain-containing protein n=1 Tax=Lutibacter holmesii TaxID=1137985 RepID=A0ABW3WSA3_9FLAO
MRKLIVLFLFFTNVVLFGQTNINNNQSPKYAFQKGEWLQYRMSYSNFLNAGYATLKIKNSKKNNKAAFHILGDGKTSGLVGLFFKVKDNYQTYIYKESLKPYRFIRKINEGGYTKNKEILFNYNTNKALVKDFKHNTEKSFSIDNDIQDMLSALYYLRNQDLGSLEINEEIELKLFFDQETYKFKLRFLGKEVLKTKFGAINSLKFRPIVQSGRVFKEEESVTIWVSDDKNKVPLKIKATLAVGSLRADLDGFKGLAHPFNIIFNN